MRRTWGGRVCVCSTSVKIFVRGLVGGGKLHAAPPHSSCLDVQQAAQRLFHMATMEMPPQRNALVLPDLLNLDLHNNAQSCCRTSSRVAEDKENVNPNSLRMQKQRRLAKARAAKKAAAASAPEPTIAPAVELLAPAAPSAPTPVPEPKILAVSRNALKREINSIVSPPLSEIQGRHTRHMRRASVGRTGSSLRDGFICSDEMVLSDSPLGPVIR